MKVSRAVGSTSNILQVFISDSTSTTGGGLTGLTHASGSLTAYYQRDTDASPTAITLVTMTVGTFTSSGFKEIDSTNMPGWYQFCPPNAAFNSGAKSVGFHLKGATNMAPLPIEIDLDSQVNVKLVSDDATAADNAESFFDGTGYAGTNNVIPTVTTTGTATNVTTVNGLAANVITAASIATGAITAAKFAASAIDAAALAADAVAEIADQVWDEPTAGHVAAGSTGAAIIAAGSAGDPWSTSIPGAYGAGTAGKIVGDNLNATVSSRASQTSVDTVDDLLDTEVVTIVTQTTAAAIRTAIGLASANLDTQLSTIDDFLDTEIAAIKAKTDLIPSDPADASDVAALIGALPSAAAIATAVLTTQMTESYAADNVAPTLAQSQFLVQQSLHEFSISGTTRTVKKLDGSTTAATFTLDSSTAPTSTTRAS